MLSAIQSHVARIAIGASTLRGRGNGGAAAAARAFLRKLDLRLFGDADAGRFSEKLDASTNDLCALLPPGARHWGIARKALNIYLRDCLYNTFLDAAFGLRNQEGQFELPLDSITAGNLKGVVGRGRLPPWPGVKHLSPALNAQFQAAAAAEAQKRGFARVHLDPFWWSVSRDHDAV
jgi:hypothetical protein